MKIGYLASGVVMLETVKMRPNSYWVIKIALVGADELRLTITGSKANPIIEIISAYDYLASEGPR